MFEFNQRYRPFRVYPHPEISNPVLSPENVDDDTSVTGVADPFVVNDDSNRFHMFFETVGDRGLNIAHAESDNGLDWSYNEIVLDKSVGMSYPQVFKWKNDWYLIPAVTPSRQEVRIYIADSFPSEWSVDEVIGLDSRVVDPTVMRWNGHWYIMYSDNTAPRISSRLEFRLTNWMYPHQAFTGDGEKLTLRDIVSHFISLERPISDIRIIYSDQLIDGEWLEHPQNPIRQSLQTERNAGRAIKFQDCMLFMFQDWENRGGEKVRGFRVAELNPSEYSDSEVTESPLIQASQNGTWNRDGMHHIDLGCINTKNQIVAVDGIRQEDNYKRRSIGIYEYRET